MQKMCFLGKLRCRVAPALRPKGGGVDAGRDWVGTVSDSPPFSPEPLAAPLLHRNGLLALGRSQLIKPCQELNKKLEKKA